MQEISSSFSDAPKEPKFTISPIQMQSFKDESTQMQKLLDGFKNQLFEYEHTRKKIKNKYLKTYKEKLPGRVESGLSKAIESGFSNKKTWNSSFIENSRLGI